MPILTSVVIECQRAKLLTEAYTYACQLMKPENRGSISEQYKKKIENIVRKQINVDENQETDEGMTPCIYCNTNLMESQLDCPNCKNISPFCIITGMRMIKEDWTYCVQCYFPAKRIAFQEALKTNDQCPMCEAQLKAADLPVVSDPSSLIAEYKTLFSQQTSDPAQEPGR